MKRVLASAIQALRNINRAIESVMNPIATVLIAAMLLTTVWGVFTRLTGISNSWTDKVMIIMLPMLAFIIAPVAYRRSANVSLDLLIDSLSPRTRNLHGLLLHLFILLLLLIGLDLTLRKVGVDPGPLSSIIHLITGLDLSEIRPFAAPMRIPVINVQWKYIYMVMPLCIALTIIANFELLLRSLLSLIDPRMERPRPVRSIEDAESKLWD